MEREPLEHGRGVSGFSANPIQLTLCLIGSIGPGILPPPENQISEAMQKAIELGGHYETGAGVHLWRD